jgi:SAM-dependent methyltransferase
MAIKSTIEKNYTESLIYRQSAWWKKLFNVQYPYRWNILRLKPGFVLDVGCGVGRNLLHLNGYGIGVDHNQTSVQVCKSKGLNAFTVNEFMLSEYYVVESFDSMLLAHVAEHMTEAELLTLLAQYSPFIKPNGKVIIITPQELGFKSDDTHVQFMNFETIKNALSKSGFQTSKQYSFPFPRIVGHFFKYNEFVSVGIKK